ncbi:MAG: hypothetical protein HDR90_07475 [Bacteroides sp.]|nr:hypothetical protein [Bacteroides sp.]
MNSQLNFNALSAWAAFGSQDYAALEKYGANIYNYFVHNPAEILNLDTPLLIGKIFQVCLGFQEPDRDIQEVRAENAFICFSQALHSDNSNVHNEAAARLMMLLIQGQSFLKNQVEQACKSGNANPYSFFVMINDGMPNDMPMAVNTKMLFVAYYLYETIKDKSNVSNEFVNPSERVTFEHVKDHVLYHCGQMGKTTQSRKAELGKIVFNKICQKLRKDVEMYSNH